MIFAQYKIKFAKSLIINVVNMFLVDSLGNSAYLLAQTLKVESILKEIEESTVV